MLQVGLRLPVWRARQVWQLRCIANCAGHLSRCLITHPPDAISIASTLKEIYEDIYVSESVCGPSCRSVVYMGLYELQERWESGERERGGGGEGERENNLFRRNHKHSVKTTRQAQHANLIVGIVPTGVQFFHTGCGGGSINSGKRSNNPPEKGS
jgi:hypothetical protein